MGNWFLRTFWCLRPGFHYCQDHTIACPARWAAFRLLYSVEGRGFQILGCQLRATLGDHVCKGTKCFQSGGSGLGLLGWQRGGATTCWIVRTYRGGDSRRFCYERVRRLSYVFQYHIRLLRGLWGSDLFRNGTFLSCIPRDLLRQGFHRQRV